MRNEWQKDRSIPFGIRVKFGIQCPDCGLVLHDSDDKATGWASRAYRSHYLKEHVK